MLSPVLLVVYALAIARVTGLVTGQDSITERPHTRVIGWLDDRPATLGSFLAKLLSCPWCASVWISAAVVPLAWWWGTSPWLLMPALVLAFAQAAGMISQVGR